MLEKSLAEDWSPSLERFISSRLPTDKLWSNLDTRLQVKAQGSLVIENDLDDVVVGRDGKLHFGNDLAFCRRELMDALIGVFAFARLMGSHEFAFLGR
jgi:hypothetical protein